MKTFERRRDTLRKSRNGIPVVALVGYTNTGKSTLMNSLTGAGTLAENRLFATLDTLTRKVETASRAEILVVDTVGFIRKLPHHLIESFKATLSDIENSDLCLHVVDVSHPGFTEQMEVADKTLQMIRGDDQDICYVFNKIDELDDETLDGLRIRYPSGLFISAAKKLGLDELLHAVENKLFGTNLQVEVKVASIDGRAIAAVKRLLRETSSRLEDGHCVFKGVIELRLMEQLENLSGVHVRCIL